MYVDKRRSFAVWYEPSPDPAIDRELPEYEKAFGPGNFYTRAPRVRDWQEFKEAILRLEASTPSRGLPGDRLPDPLMTKIEELPPQHRLTAYFCVLGYDLLRFTLLETLVKPFCVSLSTEIAPVRLTLPDEALNTHLVDEALVAFLRCCNRPSQSPEGWFLSFSPEEFVQLMGLFALADKGDHLGSREPETLTGVHYSEDPNTARRQLMVTWLELLNVVDVEAGGRALRSANLAGWYALTEYYIRNVVFSTVSRLSLEQALARSRELVGDLPPHRRRLVEDLVLGLSQLDPKGMEFESAGAGDGESLVPPVIEDDVTF